MGKMQRNKGYRGETEVVKILREHGFPARRGLVFQGESDIVCYAPPFNKIHLEVKRQETYAITMWWEQSTNQSFGEIPTVVFRKSREDWKIMMRFEDFLDLIGGQNDKLDTEERSGE